MRRSIELSETQWERIAPLLPGPAPTGRPRADDRRTVDGILFVLLTGCRWDEMPRQYGSYVTCWRRLRRWREQGIWERVCGALLQSLEPADRIAWEQALSSSAAQQMAD